MKFSQAWEKLKNHHVHTLMQNPAHGEKVEWIEVRHDNDMVIIEFKLTPTQTIETNELPQVVDYVYLQLQGSKIRKIRVTGRGPVWLYAAVVHTVAHLAPLVQVYDAVQRRWVTVVTHTSEAKIGDVEYV